MEKSVPFGPPLRLTDPKWTRSGGFVLVCVHKCDNWQKVYEGVCSFDSSLN